MQALPSPRQVCGANVRHREEQALMWEPQTPSQLNVQKCPKRGIRGGMPSAHSIPSSETARPYGSRLTHTFVPGPMAQVRQACPLRCAISSRPVLPINATASPGATSA